MTRIVAFWPFLEFVAGAAGATGETEMVSRTAARSPPPTRAGGQDDGSYTNSLKLNCFQNAYPTRVNIQKNKWKTKELPNRLAGRASAGQLGG